MANAEQCGLLVHNTWNAFSTFLGPTARTAFLEMGGGWRGRLSGLHIIVGV